MWKHQVGSSRNVHVVFGSDCSPAMDYRSLAVFHSFRTSGWTGPITRLMACQEEDAKEYKGMAFGDTFVHPDYRHMEGYEGSPTYNKPAALMHFTQEVDIKEEFILYVDADMLFRRTIDPADFGAGKGIVVTEAVWYIEQGIRNGAAKQFLKDPMAVERAKNTHGGYYHLFHRDDAKKVAPLWLHYTKEVRQHPEMYWKDAEGSTLTEDIDMVQKGARCCGAPWISEMYGYAFAAADIGLIHRFTRGGVRYSDDFLTLRHAGPFLSHYTLSCSVPSVEIFLPPKEAKRRAKEQGDYFRFEKNEIDEFSVWDCDDGYLFPSPPKVPLPNEGSGLCVESIERLNHALCDFYRTHCPVDSEAYQHSLRKCPYEINGLYPLHHSTIGPAPCGDLWRGCENHVRDGECRTNPSDMMLGCLESCGFCSSLPTTDGHCVDRLASESCREMAKEYECTLNPTYMSANCAHTCNLCPGNGSHGNSLRVALPAAVVVDSWSVHRVLGVFGVCLLGIAVLALSRTSYFSRFTKMSSKKST